MADTTTEASTNTPRLHILNIPATSDEVERDFRTPWLIDDEDRQATPIFFRGEQEEEQNTERRRRDAEMERSPDQ